MKINADRGLLSHYGTAYAVIVNERAGLAWAVRRDAANDCFWVLPCERSGSGVWWYKGARVLHADSRPELERIIRPLLGGRYWNGVLALSGPQWLMDWVNPVQVRTR